MKLKIGLFGGAGKMGKAVEQMLGSFHGKNEIIPYLFVGRNVSPVFSICVSNLKNIENEVLEDVDVWIDFSSPEGLIDLLNVTEKFKTPVVSGSTGLSEKQFAFLSKASAKRVLFWASNMSPGLWAFRQALNGLKSISHFDFAIDETHHNQKKDRPSGTAKTLQSDLEKVVGKKIEAPASHRIGGVFGVHNIYAASSNEVLMLQHQALNRTVFAEGALLAADWLVDQKPGLYSMDDLFSKIRKIKRRSK